MFKRNMIFISLILLVVAGLGVVKYLQIQQGTAMMAANAPPPTSVEVTTALQVQWQPRVSAVGTLTAREGIDVSNEVEGVIEEIHIESGQQVNKGDLLVSLNDSTLSEPQKHLVPYLKVYLQNFYVGTNIKSLDVFTLFFQYQFPRFYTGVYLEFPRVGFLNNVNIIFEVGIIWSWY